MKNWKQLIIDDLVRLAKESVSQLEGLKMLKARLDDMETLHYKGIYPEAHNYPEPVHNEPTPHTCGGCKRPWSRQGWDDPRDWVLLCDYEDGDNGEYRGRFHGQPACPNFEAVKEYDEANDLMLSCMDLTKDARGGWTCVCVTLPLELYDMVLNSIPEVNLRALESAACAGYESLQIAPYLFLIAGD